MSVRWGLVSTAPINRSIIAAARESERAEVTVIACGMRATWSHTSTAASSCHGAPSWRCSARRGFSPSRLPFVIESPDIELRRDGEVEQVAVPSADSYRLELENVSGAIRGEAALLLGRRDAVGQARTIEALHGAAA